MKSDEAIKVDCNRYHNGQCTTRACLVRGGWSPGDDYEKSVANSTCDAHEIITLRARVKELEAQVKAGIQSHYEVEQILGRALGYADPDGTVCVGEHVPETLAEEASKRIKHLFDEFDRNTSCIASYMNQAERQAERIKELLGAMPRPGYLRRVAAILEHYHELKAAEEVDTIGSTIEKVIRR